MLDLFWTVFVLALALFAAPGPITVETMRRGMRHGFWPALGVQAGAIAAELLWAAAVLGGIAPLAQHPGMQTGLAFLGTGFLLWTAWQALREAWMPAMLGPAMAAPRSAMLVGAVYAGANPLAALFWLSVAALLAAQGVSVQQPANGAMLVLAYVLSGLVWGVPVSALAAWGRRLMRPWLWRWWHTVSGLALGGYGLRLLWSALAQS